MTRRRRFGRIKQAIKNGGTGGYLDKYKTYMSGGTPITRTMPPRNGTVKYATSPFGFPITGNEWRVTMTGRADVARVGLGLDNGTINIASPTPACVYRPDWEPAKVVVKKLSGTSISKTSDITGLKYQKQGGDSYTVPFGAAGTKEEFQIQQEIASKIDAAASSFKVSYTFRPERIYRAG